MDRLDEMFVNQDALQEQLGNHLAKLDSEARVQYIKDMILACTDELHEALAEIGWKSWATSRHVNEEAAFGELRDAWQFLMNAMMAVNQRGPRANAEALYQAHNQKIAVNYARQSEGYDGITGKCPACHRDLGEQTLKEIHSKEFPPRVDIHCMCGYTVVSRLV